MEYLPNQGFDHKKQKTTFGISIGMSTQQWKTLTVENLFEFFVFGMSAQKVAHEICANNVGL